MQGIITLFNQLVGAFHILREAHGIMLCPLAQWLSESATVAKPVGELAASLPHIVCPLWCRVSLNACPAVTWMVLSLVIERRRHKLFPCVVSDKHHHLMLPLRPRVLVVQDAL